MSESTKDEALTPNPEAESQTDTDAVETPPTEAPPRVRGSAETQAEPEAAGTSRKPVEKSR